jgi:hypothetical protein
MLIAAQLIIVLPLSMIRNLAALSSTALIADAFILVGSLTGGSVEDPGKCKRYPRPTRMNASAINAVDDKAARFLIMLKVYQDPRLTRLSVIYIGSNEVATISRNGVADVALFNSQDFSLLIG